MGYSEGRGRPVAKHMFSDTQCKLETYFKWRLMTRLLVLPLHRVITAQNGSILRGWRLVSKPLFLLMLESGKKARIWITFNTMTSLISLIRVLHVDPMALRNDELSHSCLDRSQFPDKNSYLYL